MCAVPRIRPYSKKQLCSLYHISYTTLYRWLVPFRSEIDLNRRIFTIKEVKYIFSVLGSPFEDDP